MKDDIDAWKYINSIIGTWHLTDIDATFFRKNKKRKIDEDGNLISETVPVFCPPKEFEPKYKIEMLPDGHRYVYQRSATKGLKEELEPPPSNSEEAIDEEYARKNNKSKYRYLEQYEINHKKSKFLNKDGQVLFNKGSIGHIHRNELFRKSKNIDKDLNGELSSLLYNKNSDLYEDALGVIRAKEGIALKSGGYYFD